MARTATPVDRPLMEKSIIEAEANGPLRTQTDVWKAAAEIYNQTAIKQISFSVVMLRATEWGISLKTPMARKGRTMTAQQISAMQAGRGKRVARAEKFAKNDALKPRIIKLRQAAPERYHGLIDRMEKGSMKAAVALNCAICMGFENVSHEVRNCSSHLCPMWAFRPYQKDTDQDDSILEAGSDEEAVTPLELEPAA